MDPQTEPSDNLGGRRDVAFNILRPSLRLLSEIFIEDHDLQLRLKHVDDVIQKLVEPQQVVIFNFNRQFHSQVLHKIAQDIVKTFVYVGTDLGSFYRFVQSREVIQGWARRSPEEVVCFFDSATHILRCISFGSMKGEISAALDLLGFLRNLLRMIGKQLMEHDDVVGELFFRAQEIPAVISFIFSSYFTVLVDGKKHDLEFTSNFKMSLPYVSELIYARIRILYGSHRSWESPAVRDEIMNATRPAKIIDQEVVDFLGRLINKLNMKQFMSISSAPQMKIAKGELSFLRSNLLDILQAYSQADSAVKEMESLCFHTLSLIIDIAYHIYLFDHYPAFPSFLLTNLIQIVDSVKQKASDLFSSNETFALPSSRQVGSFNCLFKNLDELMNSKAASAAPLKHQIEAFYQEMVPIRQYLATEQMENSQVGFFIAQFTELAYWSSSIVDSFLAGEGSSLWHQKLGMFVFTNEARIMRKTVKSFLNKMKASDIDSEEDPPVEINTAISSRKATVEPSHVRLVGIKDDAVQIIEHLTRGSTNLQVISIIGMPGLGKTTMANFLYENPSVNMHFHVRAWCCVSQRYNRETLLADILCQLVVGETNSSLEECSGDDLAQMLYQKLKGRRYLIVLDDIWDVEVWHDLDRTFPNDDNGSRVLFTTRHSDVARKANSVQCDLRLLSDQESFKLLCFKVFDGETCPPEFSIISWRIARNCKGLPLAVILVGGILRRTERSKESWEQVAAGVKSLGGDHENQLEIMWLRKTLELSYKHLPIRLKPCFLYFAAFLEDTSISVSKLMQLWIAEGFVQEENVCHKSLEEAAESYLDELIDRSLVMIAKRSSKGGVKACRVHDVLRDFCLEKSRQAQTIVEESMYAGIIRLHLRSLMYCSKNQKMWLDVKKRVGISEDRRVLFIKKLHSRREAYTVGCFSVSQAPKRLDSDSIFNYKFLWVVDLGKVRMESSADTSDIIMIANLVHLRFLCIRLRTNEIPAQIGNLQKLETLALTGAIGYIKLPESLWNLSSLRNVLMDHGFFNFQHCSKTFFDSFLGLINLKSVSTLSLRHGDDDVVNCILMRLPCIQKLACRFLYSWDHDVGCCHFPELDFLNQLESLKLFFSGKVRFPCKTSFPSNLKKLSLSNSRLPWDEISVIVRQLPNLEVLKLLNKAFEGPQWNMRDGDEFPKLKFLKLESLNIQAWNIAEAEQLPCLEKLVVLRCPQLEEIPCCFGEILTLQWIELKWCRSSAMDSVKEILKVQRDFSNDQLKVSLVGSA